VAAATSKVGPRQPHSYPIG